MSSPSCSTNGGAGESNDQLIQNETISFMDKKYYMSAASGKIDDFRGPQVPVDVYTLLTPNENTILHVFIIARAFEVEDSDTQSRPISFVNDILSIGPLLLKKPNKKGETPLHMAARHGHDDIVRVLIDRANALLQSDVDADPEPGITPKQRFLRMLTKVNESALHEAVRLNHLEVVRTLTTEDPEFMHPANAGGETPIYLAAERGYLNIVIEILEKCHTVDHQGPNGRTSLHEAAIRGDERMARKILDNSDNLASKKDKQDWTPLHHASYHGHCGIVEQLLNSYRAAAYIGDRDGRIPLHIAASQGNSHLEVIELFLEECPDCCEVTDNKGRNVLHFILDESRYGRVDRFLAGVPLLSNLINDKDYKGDTPVHVAASCLLPSPHIITCPLADKKAVNRKNFTALDTGLTTDGSLFKLKGLTILVMKKAGFERSQRNEVNLEGDKKEFEAKLRDMEKVQQSHLVVSTLIATVTFAAGFTIPGGYHGDDHPDQQGSPILSTSTAFTAFIVTDTLALLFSIIAIFMNSLIALRRWEWKSNKEISKSGLKLFLRATMLTVGALILMVVAFATGIYAVLPHTQSGLRICLALIAALFPSACASVYQFGMDFTMEREFRKVVGNG